MVTIKREELLRRIIKGFACGGIQCGNCIFNQEHDCGGQSDEFDYKEMNIFLQNSTKEDISINDLKPFFIGSFDFNKFINILTDEDIKTIIEAVENPPKPNEALIKAQERYKSTRKEYTRQDLHEAFCEGACFDITSLDEDTEYYMFTEWFTKNKEKK